MSPEGPKKFFLRLPHPPPPLTLSEGLNLPLLMEREGKIVGLRFIRNRHKIDSLHSLPPLIPVFK